MIKVIESTRLKWLVVPTLTIPLILTGILVLGCRTAEKKEPVFEHDIKTGPTPWTNTNFELEEEDFTFALISDLNGGEREGVYSTAVAQLNRIEPTFVLSVGDLIDGGTEDAAQLTKEWDSFEELSLIHI